MGNSPEPLQHQSLVRFSAMSLLAFTTMAGILLAVIVPFVQSRPPEAQAAIYRTLAFSAAIALLAFLGICIYRRWLEIKSGPLQMRPTTVTWVKWLFTGLLAPVMIAVVIFLTTMIGETATVASKVEMASDYGLDWLIMLSLALPICYLAHLIAMLWWNVSLLSFELRQRGLIIGGLRFIPWDAIEKLEWNPGASSAFSVLKIKARAQRIALVKASEKQAVDELLRQKGLNPGQAPTLEP